MKLNTFCAILHIIYEINTIFNKLQMSATKVIISYPWIKKDESYVDENGNEPLIQPYKGLRECVAQVAKKELREDAIIKEEMLRQFRQWIKQNRDIENCITGMSFFVT